MKIRTGFVSNSSSSLICIKCGVDYESVSASEEAPERDLLILCNKCLRELVENIDSPIKDLFLERLNLKSYWEEEKSSRY